MNAIFVSICQSEYRFVLEMKGHVHEIHDVEKEKKNPTLTPVSLGSFHNGLAELHLPVCVSQSQISDSGKDRSCRCPVTALTPLLVVQGCPKRIHNSSVLWLIW